MNKKIKFGVVGCGNIGIRHAQHIASNKHAELVAICDPNESKLSKLLSQYNVKSFTCFDELLKEDLDVVCVCTPSGLHAEMSIEALNRGLHVVCEKPMTLNLEDADRIVEAERKSTKSFFLVKQNRYNPPIKVLKDYVINNKLGQINFINCNVLWNRRREYYDESNWRGTVALDGGALMTQCSHFLDLMIWIGGGCDKVFAQMRNLTHPYIETEDTGFITLSFKNGSIGSLQYTTSVYKENMEGSISVLGEKGSIKVGGQYLNELEIFNVQDCEMPVIEEGAPANDYGAYKGSMSNHDKVINNVIRVLQGKEVIAVNSIQGRESIEIMQAAYLSAIKNEYVKLPLTSDCYRFKLNEQESINGFRKGVLNS